MQVYYRVRRLIQTIYKFQPPTKYTRQQTRNEILHFFVVQVGWEYRVLALFGSKFRPSSIFGRSGGKALICWQNKNLLISMIPKLFFFPFLEQYWVCYWIFNTFYLAEVVWQTPENLWSGVPDQEEDADNFCDGITRLGRCQEDARRCRG